jgi:hypothetical protein
LYVEHPFTRVATERCAAGPTHASSASTVVELRVKLVGHVQHSPPFLESANAGAAQSADGACRNFIAARPRSSHPRSIVAPPPMIGQRRLPGTGMFGDGRAPGTLGASGGFTLPGELCVPLDAGDPEAALETALPNAPPTALPAAPPTAPTAAPPAAAPIAPGDGIGTGTTAGAPFDSRPPSAPSAPTTAPADGRGIDAPFSAPLSGGPVTTPFFAVSPGPVVEGGDTAGAAEEGLALFSLLPAVVVVAVGVVCVEGSVLAARNLTFELASTIFVVVSCAT